jgi:hypothetical protein
MLKYSKITVWDDSIGQLHDLFFNAKVFELLSIDKNKAGTGVLHICQHIILTQ